MNLYVSWMDEVRFWADDKGLDLTDNDAYEIAFRLLGDHYLWQVIHENMDAIYQDMKLGM